MKEPKIRGAVSPTAKAGTMVKFTLLVRGTSLQNHNDTLITTNHSHTTQTVIPPFRMLRSLSFVSAKTYPLGKRITALR